MMHATRILSWPTCYNCRDLGGLPTVDGRTTRMGAFVRSDLPSRLTAEGQRALLAYGIRTIIDLQRPAQVAAEAPLTFSQEGQLPTIYNIPLENHDEAVAEQIRAVGQQRAQVYCLIVDNNLQQVAQIMQTIADAPEGGILLHCHAGKDRTGIVSALLLSLAGVSHELITEDYALSQSQLWPLYETLVEEAGGEDQVGWWLKPIATPAMMHHLLDHWQMRYGGVTPYLQQAGLTTERLNAIRTRLLIH